MSSTSVRIKVKSNSGIRNLWYYWKRASLSLLDFTYVNLFILVSPQCLRDFLLIDLFCLYFQIIHFGMQLLRLFIFSTCILLEFWMRFRVFNTCMVSNSSVWKLRIVWARGLQYLRSRWQWNYWHTGAGPCLIDRRFGKNGKTVGNLRTHRNTVKPYYYCYLI